MSLNYKIRGNPWAPTTDDYERGTCVIDLLRSKGVAAYWANNYEIAFPAITGVFGAPSQKVTWLQERIDAPRFVAMSPEAIAEECRKRIIETQG